MESPIPFEGPDLCRQITATVLHIDTTSMHGPHSCKITPTLLYNHGRTWTGMSSPSELLQRPAGDFSHGGADATAASCLNSEPTLRALPRPEGSAVA